MGTLGFSYKNIRFLSHADYFSYENIGLSESGSLLEVLTPKVSLYVPTLWQYERPSKHRCKGFLKDSAGAKWQKMRKSIGGYSVQYPQINAYTQG